MTLPASSICRLGGSESFWPNRVLFILFTGGPKLRWFIRLIQSARNSNRQRSVIRNCRATLAFHNENDGERNVFLPRFAPIGIEFISGVRSAVSGVTNRPDAPSGVVNVRQSPVTGSRAMAPWWL